MFQLKNGITGGVEGIAYQRPAKRIPMPVGLGMDTTFNGSSYWPAFWPTMATGGVPIAAVPNKTIGTLAETESETESLV